MSWVVAVWAMLASACLTLAFTHVVVGARPPSLRSHLLFAGTGVSVAAIAVLELLLMHSTSVAEYARLQRWAHVPVFVTFVCAVFFVREYLRAGRLEVPWLVCGIVLFITAATVHAQLVHQAPVDSPYLISAAFLALLVIMAYRLGTDVARSAERARALGDNERRMQLALEAGDMSLWEWDITQDRLHVIHRGRIFGRERPEPANLEAFLDRVHSEDREAARAAISESLGSGNDCLLEFRINAQNPRPPRWIRTRGRLELGDDGKPALMRGVAYDITQRKQAEERMRMVLTERRQLRREMAERTDELVHLSRVAVLGELSGSLAHELKQPATAILSNAQAAQHLAQRGLGGGAELAAAVADINHEAKRVVELIERLWNLLRRGETQHKPVDMNEVVTEVLTILRSELRQHALVPTVRLAPHLPAVMGDPVQLQQVLLNLIMNALDAMRSVDTANRRLLVQTARVDAAHIQVWVTDAGTGIAPDDLQHIFEPFVTNKKQGLGLGLAVSHAIVEAHHGTIAAENNIERGAIFRVTLPVLGNDVLSIRDSPSL